VEGLVELRRSEDIARFIGGARTTPSQYKLHQSPTINDCFYRNMFSFRRIVVIDFDEVRWQSAIERCRAASTRSEKLISKLSE